VVCLVIAGGGGHRLALGAGVAGVHLMGGAVVLAGGGHALAVGPRDRAGIGFVRAVVAAATAAGVTAGARDRALPGTRDRVVTGGAGPVPLAAPAAGYRGVPAHLARRPVDLAAVGAATPPLTGESALAKAPGLGRQGQTQAPKQDNGRGGQGADRRVG